MTYDEYKNLRDKGNSHADIASGKVKTGNGSGGSSSSGNASGINNGSVGLSYQQYSQLRNQGYSHSDIVSGKVKAPVSPSAADSSNDVFRRWNDSADQFSTWAKNLSNDWSDWDSEAAGSYAKKLQQNADEAHEIMMRLLQEGKGNGDREYNAYRDYYYYFTNAVKNLNANNDSFHEYQKANMFQGSDGNYYSYDDVLKMEESLKNDVAGMNFWNGIGWESDASTMGGHIVFNYDPAEKRQKNAELERIGTWLGEQNQKRDMADWYAENFTPDMDTLKFYEDAGVRLDELQRQMEEAEKTKPDLRRQYAISDELGNVYDYDYDAYNRDLQKWNEEHSVLIEDLAAAERDNKYASDSNFRFFSVLKNSSADSPDVQAAIARGKEISDGYLAEDEEYRGVAQDYGNFGGSEGAWLYHNVKAGGNERKHADTSSWSQDKLNAYYFLLGSDMESDAERFAEITNDALSAEFMMKQVYEPIDDWQKAHPVLGDVATTAAGVVIPLYIGLPEYMANAYEYAVTGNIDPNKPSPIQISNRMVGNTANRLNGVGSLDDVTKVHIPVIGDKGLGDVYQLGISIMQSALSRGTSGGMQGVVLAQFFGSAATSGIYDGLSRGMDPGRALLLGTMNGCAEAIGEVVSLDKLLAAKNAAGMRKIFQGVLVQMGIEGSEEAFTTVMNTLADIMVNGDMSEIELSVQSYMSQGMSREEAEKRAVKEWINGVAFDAIGGALSGGISAVGTNIGRNIGTYRDSTRYLIDLANQTAEGSKSREMLPKIENELTRKSGRKPFLGINRANISASHGNQFAEQVKQDLISQNTDTAVRAIENRLTELGETGDLHQKAQVMADYLISEMSGDNEVGFGLKISDQISANATANMRQVMGELQQARENFSSADYALQNESWTDEVMKGRFLDADVLRGNRYATADYQFGRSMEKNLTQMSDLEQQISEARAELETLSPTDTERKAELRNVIQEAETKLNEARTRQNAVLQDKYDSYSETDKNASVQIDGKEYKVSGLTKDGDVKLTGADGATTTVSVDDDRLPSAFRSLALKTKALGWASSAAFDYYKPGTDINRYIARVQNIRAIASEKIGRDAFMASSVVKALDNAPLAEFLYNQGQDLHDERQQAFQDKLNETKKKIAAAKTKSEAGRVKGSGKVDTVSGFDVNGKHFEGIRGMKLSKTQQAVVDMVNSLADTLNINYVIYNGEASGVNGAYRDGADPIIAININAGKYSGGKLIRALAAETLSHELTHFIEHFAEEEYASLRDAVVDVMFNKDSDAFARRVQNAERLLPENFKGDRNDAAVREVVADACTQMLKNSEMVTEIARQNMTAAQKVKDFIDQTVEKIRNAITAAFADSDPKFYRQEAKLILDEAERIQQLWDDGLKAATENYNAVQTAEEGAGVQLQMNESDNGTVSVDENPVVSALVQTMKPKNGASLIQYQMATENDALPKQIFAFSGNGKMLTDANGNNVFLSVRDIRDAVARANGFAENDIAKVNGFLDELGDKMEDYKLKYQFVGLNDIEDAKILLDRSGKIVLSAMVKNNEYAVNFDFTKLCKKRQALQKVIEELAREKGRVTENGSVTEVNLTAGNVQHINELLAKAGVETNCLGCFVEAKRANQQQLNKLILDDWNAIVDELYPDAKYFGFADKTGDVDLHDSTTDKEAFQKYHEALRKLGEEKKKNHKSVTPVEKARLLIENVPAARFKLKYSDLATENGRTRLHQEFPEIDSYAKSRLGTASFKTVESFTPYNAEIELLGRGSSVKVKDGKIVVKKDNGSLQRRLAKIAGVRSQSFSDFIVSHVYDVMQKTAALSARELPAHTYTKEISRAVLFGMTGEKHNLSVLLEVDPSVDPWSAGLTQNGDYFVGDYQHFMLKEGQEGKAHFIQSIGLEDAKKLQNTEGYSKNCGIIVVPLSYKAYLKALNDPEMRMIIGYHSSGMPVDVKSKTHYDMAADYQGVQNTQRVVRLVKPNYAIPEGVPSYATPPGNVVPLDGTSKTLSSDLTFDIKARFEELAKGKTGNERTMAAKQTLQEFLDFMNDNGLTAETTKSEAGYGKFPLYKDVQQTRDPYMTADHYIEYCISKGELPLFWEFATNQNYYKQVFDFNMFDRLSYNEKTGRHESTADREAYAPQEAVRLLDENGELLVPKDFFKLLDKYMKDYNFQMEKVASVVPEVIEAVKADKDIVSVSEQLQVADEEYSEAVSNNDMVTARRLVNQAAKAAGAILTENGKNALHLYHGTPSFGFTEFRPGLIFLTDNKSIAAGYTANKGYGRVREISEKYIPDDGTTETLLKNIKNVLGYDFREATQADVDKVHERMRTDSEKMSARVDDLWTGEALDELGAVDGYDQDFENKLYNIAFLPGYISEYVDELFSDPESDTSKDIFNDLRKFEEDWEEVRKFFVDNYKQLKESAAKDILGLFTGYDLLDFLIDAKYRMGNALHAGDMLINQSGSFITKESQRMAVEQAKDIGSYDLYGFAGDNQLVIDGNGAFWASIQAPALGEGTFTTDQIGIKAKELGYTSVKIKNIMDSSMNNYASNVHSDVYIFFNPSQVKSADPVTYDSNGDPIPLSQRFNPESNDIQYQTSDEWQEGPVYNHRALVSEQTLDRWLDAYAATNPNYAQAFITYMRPDDFLRLTTLTKYSRMHIEEESKGFTPEQVVKASKGQPIFLDIDTETGEILGHEGRHRMVALDRAGIFQVPVLLFDSSNKYSKTPIEELVLTGQDFGRTKAILEKATVRDLQPLSTGNKDVVAEKFSKKTRTESISEKYTGRTTLQFQVASDEDYMDAVNSGNTKDQQRMVDDAARAAGYTIRAFHGSPHTGISVFDINRAGENTGVYGDRAIWFTDSEDFADSMSYQQLEGSSAFRARRGAKGKVYDTYLRINNPFVLQNMTPEMRDLLWEMNLSKLRSMGMEPSNSSMGDRDYFFQTIDEALAAGNDQYVKFYVDYSMLQDAGYDGIIARLFAKPTSGKKDNSVEYGVFSPEQIKSADPVTYDDDGNVIPLSQRFNDVRPEIQYQLSNGDIETATYILDGRNIETGETVDFISGILDGRKKGETRTHNRLSRKWLGMAKNGLVYGRVRFGQPYEITKDSPEYKDAMIEGTNYDIKDGGSKWYYPVLEKEDFRDNPRPITRNGNYGLYQYQMADRAADDTQFESDERTKAWTDLRAENEILRESAEHLAKEIEKLTKRNDKLSRELKRTTTPETRLNDAKKLARQIVTMTQREAVTTRDKQYNKEMADELAERIKGVADYIVQSGESMDYDKVTEMAYEIAQDIVSNAEAEIDDGGATKELREQMKAALKGKAIYVAPNVRADTLDWNAFKKAHRDIFTFKDNGTPIDMVYESLLDEVPGLLDPKINNPGDMLNEMAEKWDLLQPKYENPYEQYENEAVSHFMNMIIESALDGTLRQVAPTYADKMNSRLAALREEKRESVKAERQKGREKLEALREEKNSRIEEVRQEGIARKQEALAKERADKWQRVEATRQYYQEMAARATTRRRNGSTRTRIKKLINDLNNKLIHPTELNHVPPELVKGTVDILNMIDLDSGRGGVKLAEKIAMLQQQYAKLQSDPSFAKYAYDSVVAENITKMAQVVGDTPLRSMSANQLEVVLHTLTELEYMIRAGVKQKLHNDNVNMYESGKNAIKATNGVSANSSKLLGNAADWYVSNTMRPDVVFDRFGGFAKDSEWVKLFNMLNNAQRYGMDLQMKFAQPFEALLKDKKNLAKLTSAKDEDLVDIGLKDENGDAIKVTRDFMLFVYMNLFNEDNIRHVMFGGITVPEIKEYLAGKGDRGFGKGHRKAVGISVKLAEINDAINNATDATEKARLLEEKDRILQEGMEYIDRLRSNIESKLTDYDKKWVDAWWKFNEMASEAMNQTTMDVYGIKKFIVENYFPIITDKNYVDVPMETIIKDMSYENAGFTKERLHASTPIKMMGLADVINMQANRTAQYAAMMPAVRAFNRIWNTTLPGYSNSLRDVLNSKFGSQGVKFVENLLSDLQGGRRGDFTIFDRLRGRMAQATLSLNPRVALAQTASFPTAAAELGWRPVMKALARGGKKDQFISAADRELIAKWSSALWFRTKGATADLADVKNMQQASHKVMDKMGWAMNWIEFMDGATVGRLWYAAQYYVDEKNPELKKGSDAYYEKVAEAFNRCVERTQPNYTTLQRPELLRNPHATVRALTMFMTQRLQNQSILYGAVMKYNKYKADLASGKNGVTQTDVSEMRDRLINAATSQIVAGFTIALFKFLCDGLLHRWGKNYRDDDNELTAGSISLEIMDMWAESLVSNVVGGSELYTIVKSIITGDRYYGIELSGVSTFTDAIKDFVSLAQKPSLKGAKKLGQDFCMFFGIPEANAEKIGMALWNWGKDIVTGNGFMESGVERTSAQNARLLIKAYEAEDEKKIERFSGEFKDDDTKLDAVRQQIKDGYVAKKQTISKTEAVDLLVKAGMRRKDAEAKVQEWTCEIVTGIPFSKIKDEFMKGNITQFRVAELLQKYGGRTKENAEKTALSYACEKDTGHPYNDLKDAYLEGEITRSQLTAALKKYGLMNGKESENKATFYDYLKDMPDSKISEQRAVTFMQSIKKTGVTAKQYEDMVLNVDADDSGGYSQKEVGGYIQKHSFTDAQINALWKAFGKTWKTDFYTWEVKVAADATGTGKGLNNGNVSQAELGYYLADQIRAGKMTIEQAEKYWKSLLTTSKKTFSQWCKSKRIKFK